MTPRDRIAAYFEACGTGTAADIAEHFSADAVIYDTNIAPARTANAIAEMWLTVRERWGGARWRVDSCVSDGQTAAIEWSMTGTDSRTGRAFTFRGSEHYEFDDSLIAEIRQYWTFDRAELDTGLVGYDYGTDDDR